MPPIRVDSAQTKVDLLHAGSLTRLSGPQQAQEEAMQPQPATSPDQADADADQAAEQPEQAPTAEPGVLAAAVAAGAVHLYRARRTGTLRRLTYLAPASEGREEAEWYALRLDEGATINQLAGEVGVRPLTVRRALWALDLTEALEAGDLDDLYDPATEDPDNPALVLQFGDDLDYPNGETPLTDPANVGGHIVDGAE
jgi:hypothetical protein